MADQSLYHIPIADQLAAIGCSHHRDPASKSDRHVIYVTKTRERIGLMDAFEAADWCYAILTAGD